MSDVPRMPSRPATTQDVLKVLQMLAELTERVSKVTDHLVAMDERMVEVEAWIGYLRGEPT